MTIVTQASLFFQIHHDEEKEEGWLMITNVLIEKKI